MAARTTLSKRNRPLAALAAFGALFAVTLSAATSHASTTIAGDLDYALPIDSDADSGAGFGIRVGQQLHLPLIVINPELGFTYHGFPDEVKAYRGVLGLRAGFGELIRPGVFAHVGLGSLALPDPLPSHTALTYDGGVFIDFTLIPLLNIGAHAAYNRLNSGKGIEALEWATFGAHAALVF